MLLFRGMNALSKRLLPLILLAIAVTSLFSVQPSQANFIETLQQVGTNVVATGTGAIDLTGLTLRFPAILSPVIVPSLPGIINRGPWDWRRVHGNH
jgi:hypothetical protein